MVNHTQYSVLFTIRSSGKQHAVLRVVYRQVRLNKNHSLLLTTSIALKLNFNLGYIYSAYFHLCARFSMLMNFSACVSLSIQSVVFGNVLAKLSKAL